jgi:hypothetical protein
MTYRLRARPEVEFVALIIGSASVSISGVSITEIKKAVGELSPAERYELMRWLETEEANYGDLSEEALLQIASETAQMLDREEAERDRHGQSPSR